MCICTNGETHHGPSGSVHERNATALTADLASEVLRHLGVKPYRTLKQDRIEPWCGLFLTIYVYVHVIGEYYDTQIEI
jgi:hypothetical protein